MQRAGTNSAIKGSGDIKNTKVIYSTNELKSKSEVVVQAFAQPASSPVSRDATPVSSASAINNVVAFRAVDPFDLHIRHLSLTVAQPTKPFLGKWASGLRRRVGRSRNVKEVRDRKDAEIHSFHSEGDDLKKLSTQSQDECPTASILSNISADIPSGSLTAVLGSSGSGKTTLLNVLAGRLRSSNSGRDIDLRCNDDNSCRRSKTHNNAGRIIRRRGGCGLHLSGSKWFVASHGCAGVGIGARISSATTHSTPQQIRSLGSNQSASLKEVITAYVTQQDVLLPTLTVRETLRYAADLRLTELCKKEKDDVVQQVILELGLKDVADTKIGSSTGNGCSGGEKRRTSIGVQLLANPSVLFLDEPTTGLDASTAFQLAKTLKNLALRGRNVVLTIHQPRSEIWGLFNNVILLAKGAAAYCGPSDQCIPYFSQLGYELPAFVNPAEYLIDAVAIDNRSAKLEDASTLRRNHLLDQWAKVSDHKFRVSDDKATCQREAETATLVAKKRCWFTFFDETWVQASRDMKIVLRDPLGIIGVFLEAVAMAVVTGWIFLSLDGSEAGIRSRQGALYTAAVMQGYLVLQYETYRLTSEIKTFDRERAEGMVGISSFLISRRLSRLFLEDIPIPLIFSVIFYHMVGFRLDFAQFGIFTGIMLLEHYLAVCFAMLCVAMSRSFAGASLFGNVIYSIQTLACGYFINPMTIPVYVRWTKWVSYLFYIFGALCGNEFSGHMYDCPQPGGRRNPACLPYNGDYILRSTGFQPNWILRPVLALIGFVFVIYSIAGLVLWANSKEIQLSQPRLPREHKYSSHDRPVRVMGMGNRTVSISLNNIGIDVQRRSWRLKWEEDFTIIRPLSASFEPGILNVIMGPSGSGKTSLLRSMTRRLKTDFKTRYKCSGEMLLNGAAPSDEVVRSVCAYVAQDDDALLPSLTVRETLRFAAGLRLPSWMSREEKENRADAVMHQLSLKDCANTLIGSEFLKGISGGEKRRVSIGVQILTNPSVIFLDEPTSGLDAFSTISVVDVLLRLAQEGRTIVMTLHQCRSDLFANFGKVLLLARGGSSVYAGPGNEMLDYFAAQGYKCPHNTNPADFALDLITVDLQCEVREARSRSRVCKLVDNWTDGNNVKEDKLDAASSISTSSNVKSIGMAAELATFRRNTASFYVAFPLLVERAMKNHWRQPQVMNARLMQLIGYTINVTLFFAPLRNDYAGIQNRLGLIHEIAPAYFLGLIANVAVYPSERATFYREHDDSAYRVEAFLTQYTVLEIPFEVISSLIFALLIDLAVGLPRTIQMFIVVAYNCFCLLNCGESVGIIFNTFFAHTGFAVNVTALILSLSKILGGIMSINMPTFLEACNLLSPVKYAFASMAAYVLRDQRFECDDAGIVGQVGLKGELVKESAVCPIQTGEQVLQLYELDGLRPDVSLMALGLCTVLYRLLAYLVLKFNREGWRLRPWQ